jgi:RimJ/RimL family protein N-acetyltransferase
MQLLADPRVRVNAIAVDGITVGYVGSFFSDSEREVTYWVDRRYWGKGVATAALEAFLRDEITRPVVARVARDNARSVRVLEKCGFVLVAHTTGYAPQRSADIEELVFRLV